MSEQETKAPEYMYAKYEDAEAWHCYCPIECANEVADYHPKEGQEVTIYRGDKDPVLLSEILPDLEDYMEERLEDEIGEVAQNLVVPESLQGEFEKLVQKHIGDDFNFGRISEIVPIKMVFRDGDWVESELVGEG